MRTIFPALLVGLLVAAPVFAADTAPSEESIRRLLTATESKKLIDNAIATVDASMENGMKSALGGKQLDEQTQSVMDETRTKMSAVVRETLAWQDLEPLMIDVYKRSLSQAEVNGMLKFYESDIGKAVVRKLPLIQQNTMQLMQERMKVLMPKMIQIQQEAAARLKAGKTQQ